MRNTGEPRRQRSAQMQLDGIHHITAITGDAPRQRRLLHARARACGWSRRPSTRTTRRSTTSSTPTSRAHPGSDLTFFEFPGARRGRAGDGMVHRDRLARRVATRRSTSGPRGSAREDVARRARDGTLRFADPEGLDHELRVVERARPAADRRAPGDPGASSRCRASSRARLRARARAQPRRCSRRRSASSRGEDGWEVRGERRGGRYSYDEPPAEPRIPARGTVHHVAWAARSTSSRRGASALARAGAHADAA